MESNQQITTAGLGQIELEETVSAGLSRAAAEILPDIPSASDCERNEANSSPDPAINQSVNRVHKHKLPKQRIAARLRRLGVKVGSASSAGSYDLLVNGDVRVALRVAYPGLRRHRVTVAGKSYSYRYRTWHFNFHHHGRLSDRYTDFFVCIAVNPKGRDEIFVIPWTSLTGKTFSLHGGRGRYNGRYAAFRDDWDQIVDGAKRTDGLQHVA